MWGPSTWSQIAEANAAHGMGWPGVRSIQRQDRKQEAGPMTEASEASPTPVVLSVVRGPGSLGIHKVNTSFVMTPRGDWLFHSHVFRSTHREVFRGYMTRDIATDWMQKRERNAYYETWHQRGLQKCNMPLFSVTVCFGQHGYLQKNTLG